MDITYLNLSGTFYCLCAVIDCYSRFLVHWDIRTSMKECEVEQIIQRARELHPGATPRIISDNGPQFIARDFKGFVRMTGMTHVRTSPYYPQSNGKIDRFNKTLKQSAIRPKTPLTMEDAQRVVTDLVKTYNTQRLHSAIDYVTPEDKLAGRETAMFQAWDRKIEEARAQRAQRAQKRAQCRTTTNHGDADTSCHAEPTVAA